MTDLLYILAVLILVGTAIALLRQRLELAAWRVEVLLSFGSQALTLFITAFVTAEISSRYFFNAPIPGHLELSELFMPAIVYLSIAFTQSTDGHVGLTVAVDQLPLHWRRRFEALSLALSLLVTAVLCYYTVLVAWDKFLDGDITMTPPYFKTWPSAAVVALGMLLLSLRMYLQLFDRVFPSWKLQALHAYAGPTIE